MSGRVSTNCPFCSQAMQLDCGGASRLAVTCPYCTQLFEIQVEAPAANMTPPVYQPNSGYHPPLAPPPPNYQAPIRSPRLTKQPTKRGPNPLLLYGLPASLVVIILVAIVGYVALRPNGSELALQSEPEQSPTTVSEASSTTVIPSVSDFAQSIQAKRPAENNGNQPSGLADSGFSGIGSSFPTLSNSPPRSNFESPINSTTSQGPNSTFTEPSSSFAASADTTRNAPTASNFGGSSTGSSSEALEDVIERCERSVVRIEVKGRGGESLGSGFVVDNDGTLVTNCHVLRGAMSAEVHFPDGTAGTILGTMLIDEARDIIIAKIEPGLAPPITISTRVPRKGEAITALGSPFGLSFTATTGIVSAVREGTELDSDRRGKWIQVDAPLSPGNSGGPLIDQQGTVIAMSTLASQGSAQNLNFGISSIDVQEAIDQARSQRLIPLVRGVAKMRDERKDDPQESGPLHILDGEDIPQSVIQQYVTSGVKDYRKLVDALRTDFTVQTAEIREMQKGQTSLPFEAARLGLLAVREPIPGEKHHRWRFESNDVKQSMIEKQKEKIKSINQLRLSLKDSDSDDSLFKLLWQAGPEVDIRRQGSVGFARDIIVINAFNEHDVIVAYNDAPFIIWAPSTAGLYPGTILSGPVYVQGTATVTLGSGLTTSVTALQLVTEQELLTSISQRNMTADGSRIWRDNSGKFSVEATLLAQDGDKVVLRKKDGSIVTVPKENLSETDRDFLGN